MAGVKTLVFWLDIQHIFVCDPTATHCARSKKRDVLIEHRKRRDLENSGAQGYTPTIARR
jgi:hypothetical protein